MLDRTTVEALLDTLHTLRVNGDAEALADLFAADATFRIAGFGATLSGRDAVRSELRSLIERFPFLAFRSITTMIDGDKVAVRSAVTLRHPTSGEPVETETSDFLTIRNGKIATYVQYVDTRLASDLDKA